MKNEDIKKIRDSFREKLRLLIIEKGISQNKAADEIGIPHGTFAGWLRGQSYPKAEKMKLLEDYFGVTLSDVSGLEEKKKIDLVSLFLLNDIMVDGVDITEKQKEQLLIMARSMITK